MKHFVWMLCGIFLSGLLLGSLSACGAGQTSGASSTECPSSPETEEQVPAEETAPTEESAQDESRGESAQEDGASPSGASAQPDKDAARRLAYAKVLEDALLNGVLPDGTALDYIDAETAAHNDFAVFDADGDGEEELVLLWADAGMAGMTGIVYGFRDGAVYEELSEFPGFTFYANGAVTADWSHNQGWAGRFWPYNLYRYDTQTGVYESVGTADAWDRSLFEDDEVLRAAFPADADADGDGLVYYILTGDWYNRQRGNPGEIQNGRLWETDPVDRAALESWLAACTGGTDVVQIPRQKLTLENISALA